MQVAGIGQNCSAQANCFVEKHVMENILVARCLDRPRTEVNDADFLTRRPDQGKGDGTQLDYKRSEGCFHFHPLAGISCRAGLEHGPHGRVVWCWWCTLASLDRWEMHRGICLVAAQCRSFDSRVV